MIHWKKLSVEMPPPDVPVMVRVHREDLFYPMVRYEGFNYCIFYLEPPSDYKFDTPRYCWMNQMIELEASLDDEWVMLQ